MRTNDFVQGRLGFYDGAQGRGVVVKEAPVDLSDTGRNDTGIFVPQGAQIVDLKLVSYVALTATTNISIGHVSDDDAFASAVSVRRAANSVTTFGDAQKDGKASALQNVGADTTLFTKSNRSQANAAVVLQVAYINPVVDDADSGQSPGDSFGFNEFDDD